MKKKAFLMLSLMTTTAGSYAAGYTMCNPTACEATKVVTAANDYAATKFPIVLAHGVAGANKTGDVPRWYQIPQDLAENGANVYATKMSAFNNTAVRGEQLLKQIETIMAITGAQKVNLIGHSQGGYSIRYVLGVKPQIVASATTIASPHTGTGMMDFLKKLTTSTGTSSLTGPVATIVNAFGQLLDTMSGGTQNNPLAQDAQASMNEMTAEGAKAFTAKFPAGVPTQSCGEGDYTYQSIPLFSWSGVAIRTNSSDPTDLMLSLTSLTMKEKSDGLVGKCSSHFGKVLRDDYLQNHFDETNEVRGLVNATAEPKALFRQHANRLKSLGL